MQNQNLIDIVDSLSRVEQECVLQFIKYLRCSEEMRQSPFVETAERFIAEHPTSCNG